MKAPLGDVWAGGPREKIFGWVFGGGPPIPKGGKKKPQNVWGPLPGGDIGKNPGNVEKPSGPFQKLGGEKKRGGAF